MDRRKTYGQFCGLARALNHVGDRWSLLVVRELLLGPRAFKELEQALPGMSTALLVERLRALEADGLVARNDAPVRSKSVVYALTEAGAGLEPAVLALIRWGARYMAAGPGDDAVDARWAALALKALLEGNAGRGRSGRVHLDVEGVDVTLTLSRGRRRVAAGRPESAAAGVSAPMPELLAVAAGLTPPERASLTVTGDRALALAALTPGGES